MAPITAGLNPGLIKFSLSLGNKNNSADQDNDLSSNDRPIPGSLTWKNSLLLLCIAYISTSPGG
jgi:hypothetical protein